MPHEMSMGAREKSRGTVSIGTRGGIQAFGALIVACAVLGVPGCVGDIGREGSSVTMSEETERERVAGEAARDPGPSSAPTSESAGASAAVTEIATLGAGCFWCIEAVLEQIDGVRDVASGYMGGGVANPSYEQVCGGRTGHAEVVQVTFDPKRISYEQLLEHFWKLHDPTTRDRQGNDVGPQYRSAIFYHSEAQRQAAERSKQAADASGAFPRAIVTEITAAGPFYRAENYHQDFYRLNKTYPYCQVIIAPKLDKLGLEK
jgi:peptide-methionine (S)-S-oxide reductase